jgi:hypothetical protein
MAVIAEKEHAADIERKPPGTIIETEEELVHGRVLVPRPTQDPNDPLVCLQQPLNIHYILICSRRN